MGFFNKLFGKSSNQTSGKNSNDFVSYSNEDLSSEKELSLKTLNLRKDVLESLCLEKKELSNLTSRVAVVMDYSGSMDNLYYNGTVQKILERLLPLALKFDDNGELETWIFSNDCYRLENITKDNYFNYIENENILNNYCMRGTHFVPVMKDVVKKYIKEEPCDLPTYVIFITDGENSDQSDTTKFIIENCKQPIFWQFVGIGNSLFMYLKKLDEMDGREIDNVNFFAIEDLLAGKDEDLYNKLLTEYPSWLNLAKSKGIIK